MRDQIFTLSFCRTQCFGPRLLPGEHISFVMMPSVFSSILFFPSCSVQSSVFTFCFMPYSEFQISTAFLQMLGFIGTIHFTKFTFPRSLSHMLRGSVRRNCTWNEKCSLDNHRYKLQFNWNSSQKVIQKGSRSKSSHWLGIAVCTVLFVFPNNTHSSKIIVTGNQEKYDRCWLGLCINETAQKF